MTRSSTSIRQSLAAKLPSGFALAKRDGVLDAVYSAFAAAFAIAEQDVHASSGKSTRAWPISCYLTLNGFWAVILADAIRACQKTGSAPERLAYQRWTAQRRVYPIFYQSGYCSRLRYKHSGILAIAGKCPALRPAADSTR